jgi:hypothetical protein
MIKYATIKIIMKKTPIVTITCYRDLPLLELQAQSICKFLDKELPIFLIVNEEDPEEWLNVFNNSIRHYYLNHSLTIITKKEFEGAWHSWTPSQKNPWAVGWETQQVLKLLVSEIIFESQYLVLDSQNFLIKQWSTVRYDSDKVPARCGHFSMPVEIWEQYSNNLEITVDQPTSETMSICTPIFFNTDVVKQLIVYTGGYKNFAQWFKNASKIKSEFILYALWLEKLGGLHQFHNMIPTVDDWGSPYLRDCNSSKEFEDFLNFIGVHPPHSWVSVNHRAWGNMNKEQYQQLSDKLGEYNLQPNFDSYRSSYVDIKI